MLELEMLGRSHHASKETAVISRIDDPEDPRIIGFRDIRERDLVGRDRACCDPFYRKAIRVSVGASLTLPIARFDSGTDYVGRLTEQGIACVALSPTGAIPLRQLRRTARMALFLGAEGPGLPDHILARTRTVAIRMDRKMDSLNVATTSGIVLHHLTAQEISSANS